jgi:hypothetical protein
MMLRSYAAENFCKGCLAAQLPQWERERLQRVGKLPNSLEGHTLETFIKKIRMPILADDKDLLHRMTLSAIWRGRYPVADKYQNNDGKFFGANDIPRIKDFLQRLRQYVNAPETYRIS